MDIKGKRFEQDARDVKPKRKRDNTTHRQLCIDVAKWLLKPKRYHHCKYVAIELATYLRQTPDVFGWEYNETIQVEVKVSRADYLKDTKKSHRLSEEEQIGDNRYVCCPKGIITKEELDETHPEWGLIYKDGDEFYVEKPSHTCFPDHRAERVLMNSILRREGILPGRLFDYRNSKSNTYK